MKKRIPIIPKIICGVLLSIFILTSQVMALDIEYGKYSARSEKLKATLTFSEGAEFIQSKLVLAEITISVVKNIGDENLMIKMKATSNSTGDVVKLSQKEYQVISQLLSNLDYSRWGKECGHFLYTGLNLLQSWPPALPVFAVIGGGKTFYMTPQNEVVSLEEDSYNSIWGELVVPEGKELESPPGAGEDLCEKKRSDVDGHVLCFGEIDPIEGTIEAWTETFTMYLDDTDRCNGRCGIGCTNDMSDRITYTQRCFNHDECVAMYGYFSSNCNAMFVHCIEDYWSGPICYEIWISSDN